MHNTLGLGRENDMYFNDNKLKEHCDAIDALF